MNDIAPQDRNRESPDDTGIQRRLARCIFCKQRLDRGNASREHVIPAGLGSHADAVVEEVSCTRCNNHLGRQVDEALVHLFEVQFIRGLHRVPDKRGRRVSQMPLSNGTLVFTDSGGIEVTVHEDGHLRHKDPETLLVTLVSKRRRSGDQWRRATRALLKTGLLMIHLGDGREVALNTSWDALRRAIFGRAYDSYMLIGKFDPYLRPDVEASLRGDIPGVNSAVQLRFGGLDLIADLNLRKLDARTAEWAAERHYQSMEIGPLRACGAT